MSKPGSRFERSDDDPFTLTDVAPEETGDGSREWCFKVQGLDQRLTGVEEQHAIKELLV